jgi:hypothetical protein
VSPSPARAKRFKGVRAIDRAADEDDTGNSPIDALEQCWQARDWTGDRDGDEEISVSVTANWTSYELRAVWREQDAVLQFLVLPDLKIPAERRVPVHEAIGLANEQLWLGHFELWSRSGLLVYRHAALLDAAAEAPLSAEQADTLTDAALDEFERFWPVFQFLLTSERSPAEAMAAALIETAGEA